MATSPVGWVRSTCSGPDGVAGGARRRRSPVAPAWSGRVAGRASMPASRTAHDLRRRPDPTTATGRRRPGRRRRRAASRRPPPHRQQRRGACSVRQADAVHCAADIRPAGHRGRRWSHGRETVDVVVVVGVLGADRPSLDEQAATAATATSTAPRSATDAWLRPSVVSLPGVGEALSSARRILDARCLAAGSRTRYDPRHASRRRAARIVRPVRPRLLAATTGLPRGCVQGAARRAAAAVLQGVGVPRLAVPRRARVLRARPATRTCGSPAATRSCSAAGRAPTSATCRRR